MKLGLGTAQFGSDYGISNHFGICPRSQVSEILSLAKDAGIRDIDTAAAYGISEDMLGRLLPTDHGFRVITKIETCDDAEAFEAAFAHSLRRLRQNHVHALLLHQAEDLLRPEGASLWKKIRELQDRGFVKEIGVSTRTPDEIDRLLGEYDIDMVQVPINVFDQRLLHGGQLSRLKERNIKVHARSVFLQGLLLMDPCDLYPALDMARDPLSLFRQMVEDASLTPLQAALGFVHNLPEIDCAFVGAATAAQFREILDTASSRLNEDFETEPLAVDDERILNPATWPQCLVHHKLRVTG